MAQCMACTELDAKSTDAACKADCEYGWAAYVAMEDRGVKNVSACSSSDRSRGFLVTAAVAS